MEIEDKPIDYGYENKEKADSKEKVSEIRKYNSDIVLLNTCLSCLLVIVVMILCIIMMSGINTLKMWEPSLSGVMPGKDMPKLILAQDVDFPPFASVGKPPDASLSGFVPDFIQGM